MKKKKQHTHTTVQQWPGARFKKKNLRKNPKFMVSFSQVYVKFIESYKVKIFTEF